MDYYKYIDEGDTDEIISELCSFISLKCYNDNYEFKFEKVEKHSFAILNGYTIWLNDIEINIYTDSIIGIVSDVKHINGIPIETIQNDIGCFLKYYKRKNILDELL